MNYIKIDIINLIENYKKTDRYNIKFLPKPNEKEKIIKQWFKYEDIKTLSNISGKTTIEIVNILEDGGLL